MALPVVWRRRRWLAYKEKARLVTQAGLENNPGSDLLSHTVTHAVPSAVTGLTSVFGMVTVVTLLLCPPGNLAIKDQAVAAEHTPAGTLPSVAPKRARRQIATRRSRPCISRPAKADN